MVKYTDRQWAVRAKSPVQGRKGEISVKLEGFSSDGLYRKLLHKQSWEQKQESFKCKLTERGDSTCILSVFNLV
jgi:hypothetical protein